MYNSFASLCKGNRMEYPAIIDEAKCIGCTQCKLICPVNAIYQQSIICIVENDKCICCGNCIDVCPMNCIKESTDVVGANKDL